MKMTSWSPDERLCPLSRFSQLSPEERFRIAADCLSRLRDVGPDPMTRLNGRHTRRDVFVHFLSTGRVRSQTPFGGEFQPSFATVHAGGGAHFITLLHFIFALRTVF